MTDISDEQRAKNVQALVHASEVARQLSQVRQSQRLAAVPSTATRSHRDKLVRDTETDASSEKKKESSTEQTCSKSRLDAVELEVQGLRVETGKFLGELRELRQVLGDLTKSSGSAGLANDIEQLREHYQNFWSTFNQREKDLQDDLSNLRVSALNTGQKIKQLEATSRETQQQVHQLHEVVKEAKKETKSSQMKGLVNAPQSRQQQQQNNFQAPTPTPQQPRRGSDIHQRAPRTEEQVVARNRSPSPSGTTKSQPNSAQLYDLDRRMQILGKQVESIVADHRNSIQQTQKIVDSSGAAFSRFDDIVDALKSRQMEQDTTMAAIEEQVDGLVQALGSLEEAMRVTMASGLSKSLQIENETCKPDLDSPLSIAN